MKKVIFVVLIGFLSALVSCKKDKEPEVKETPVYRTKADDANARVELDKSYDDIEKVFNSQEYADASARTAAVVLPCGNVSLNGKNFTIEYNGANCGSRVLSGSIDVSLVAGEKFSDQNAKLQINFNDYKVLYNANNQSIVYNGTAYVINATGGTLISLFINTPNVIVEHKVRGALALTFDSTGTGSANVTRNWNLFRKKTYQNSSGTPSGITLTVSGDTSIANNTYMPGTYASVSEYGIGREGYKFVSTLTTPFRWENCGNSYSGPYILKQGKVDFTTDLSTSPVAILGIAKKTFSATAGYRFINLNEYVLDGGCSSNGYKLEVVLKNASDVILYSTASFQVY